MAKKYKVVVKNKRTNSYIVLDSFKYTTNNRDNIKSFCDKVYNHSTQNYIEVFDAETNVIMCHRFNNKWTS